MKKRGNILTENIIFIILNLVFIAMLIIFVFSKTGGAAVLEEKYAKQIALMIDSAKPRMVITLKMDDAMEQAIDNLGEKGINEMVRITGNVVNVKLRDEGGYSYSFFNDVEVNCYPLNNKEYIFIVDEKNSEALDE